MSKFPNVDIEAVKQHFPNVDLETIKTLKRARGHHVPE